MRAHAGRPDSNENFQLPPKIKRPNLHIVRYTCQCKQYQLLTQNERRAHPNWAPTKEPKRELLELYSNLKQDRFQDLLEAICPDYLHTNLSKKNKYYIYSNIPQLLSAEVVLCTHKTTFSASLDFFVTNSPPYLHQFSTIFGGNCIRLTSLIVRLPS